MLHFVMHRLAKPFLFIGIFLYTAGIIFYLLFNTTQAQTPPPTPSPTPPPITFSTTSLFSEIPPQTVFRGTTVEAINVTQYFEGGSGGLQYSVNSTNESCVTVTLSSNSQILFTAHDDPAITQNCVSDVTVTATDNASPPQSLESPAIRISVIADSLQVDSTNAVFDDREVEKGEEVVIRNIAQYFTGGIQPLIFDVESIDTGTLNPSSPSGYTSCATIAHNTTTNDVTITPTSNISVIECNATITIGAQDRRTVPSPREASVEFNLQVIPLRAKDSIPNERLEQQQTAIVEDISQYFEGGLKPYSISITNGENASTFAGSDIINCVVSHRYDSTTDNIHIEAHSDSAVPTQCRYDITVRARDSSSPQQSTTQRLRVLVDPFSSGGGGTPPFDVSTIAVPTPTLYEGEVKSISDLAQYFTGGSSPYSYSFATSTSTTCAQNTAVVDSKNAQTLILTAHTNNAGACASTDVTITATDSNGATAQRTLTLTVSDNPGPQVVSAQQIPDSNVEKDTSKTIGDDVTTAFSAVTGTPLEYSAVAADPTIADVFITQDNKVFTIGKIVGDTDVTITATQTGLIGTNANKSVSYTFNLEVIPAAVYTPIRFATNPSARYRVSNTAVFTTRYDSSDVLDATTKEQCDTFPSSSCVRFIGISSPEVSSRKVDIGFDVNAEGAGRYTFEVRDWTETVVSAGSCGAEQTTNNALDAQTICTITIPQKTVADAESEKGYSVTLNTYKPRVVVSRPSTGSAIEFRYGGADRANLAVERISTDSESTLYPFPFDQIEVDVSESNWFFSDAHREEVSRTVDALCEYGNEDRTVLRCDGVYKSAHIGDALNISPLQIFEEITVLRPTGGNATATNAIHISPAKSDLNFALNLPSQFSQCSTNSCNDIKVFDTDANSTIDFRAVAEVGSGWVITGWDITKDGSTTTACGTTTNNSVSARSMHSCEFSLLRGETVSVTPLVEKRVGSGFLIYFDAEVGSATLDSGSATQIGVAQNTIDCAYSGDKTKCGYVAPSLAADINNVEVEFSIPANALPVGSIVNFAGCNNGQLTVDGNAQTHNCIFDITVNEITAIRVSVDRLVTIIIKGNGNDFTPATASTLVTTPLSIQSASSNADQLVFRGTVRSGTVAKNNTPQRCMGNCRI